MVIVELLIRLIHENKAPPIYCWIEKPWRNINIRRKRVYQQLKLNQPQLMDIAFQFADRVHEGLKAENREIKCLPTYIPVKNGYRNGTSYVLDLGGSKVRAGIVTVTNQQYSFEDSSGEKVMPWKRGIPFDKKSYLEILAKLLESIAQVEPLPLGFCFSYPSRSDFGRDTTLLQWTKGVIVPDTEGKKMGKMLLDYMSKQKKRFNCNRIAVINDTVASLFASLTGSKSDCQIGLVVGTGNNMASFFNSTILEKLSPSYNLEYDVPVNLESGNFTPPFLTEWDKAIDTQSTNPGCQRMEKAVSGAYLGRIFKAVFPESHFSITSEAKELVNLLNNREDYPEEWIRVAQMIYFRSASLVAATLAGLISIQCKTQSAKTFKIIAEGGLFWSQLQGEYLYSERIKTTLFQLLKAMDLSFVKVELVRIENANLVGSALAALTP